MEKILRRLFGDVFRFVKAMTSLKWCHN